MVHKTTTSATIPKKGQRAANLSVMTFQSNRLYCKKNYYQEHEIVMLVLSLWYFAEILLQFLRKWSYSSNITILPKVTKRLQMSTVWNNIFFLTRLKSVKMIDFAMIFKCMVLLLSSVSLFSFSDGVLSNRV